MKKIFALIVIFYMGNAYALGGFNTYSEADQNVLNAITKELGIVDKDNSIKEDIYSSISHVLESAYFSYYLDYNDLSASKYGDRKGYVHFIMPTVDEGVHLLAFSKRPDVDQIIITMSQVRHGSQKGALSVFEERKSDSENYKVMTENDSFAMTQESGAVSFTTFDVGSGTGSVIYTDQTYIDL